uniref:Uncharacterized protein n=1 Tax=Thermosporothrix sp. COM3 TaxID=2490863 RepID=A0A455SSK3_9CHLR|nr:hypothetical protein KTC_48520 [Thermosporothrix sp. COM3]BBH90166.1 hypothetical protein KTC_49170 [Thermosporothrix sp. COM3]BBH90231.1 hypothetical protein KTC_49820 [Thermosporothrix sp. COM3]
MTLAICSSHFVQCMTCKQTVPAEQASEYGICEQTGRYDENGREIYRLTKEVQYQCEACEMAYFASLC